MNVKLDKVQDKLKRIAESETSSDALRVIEKLSAALEELRQEFLYEVLETPAEPDDAKIRNFRQKIFEELKDERVGDLAMSYNKAYMLTLQPSTRLALVSALIDIANLKKSEKPELWVKILDARGHI